MRITVTGAGGQLGRALVRAAREAGHEVAGFSHAELDIGDLPSVSRALSLARPEVLVNCAAYNEVDRAETDWEGAFLVNAVGVKNLATAASEMGALMMHFSTDYVFRGDLGRPYTISDVPDPINAYGQSKLLGEEMLREVAARHFLVRTSWVFGRGKSSFPLKLRAWAAERDVLRVVQDQVSRPTYAVDLAEATLGLLARGEPGTYHVTNSGYCSRYEWACHILSRLGWKGRVEPARSAEFKTAAERPAFSVLDTYPVEHVLGKALPSWQDATDRFLKELG
jgi:dTDP-4-dehydrorhamnose reductase